MEDSQLRRGGRSTSNATSTFACGSVSDDQSSASLNGAFFFRGRVVFFTPSFLRLRLVSERCDPGVARGLPDLGFFRFRCLLMATAPLCPGRRQTFGFPPPNRVDFSSEKSGGFPFFAIRLVLGADIGGFTGVISPCFSRWLTALSALICPFFDVSPFEFVWDCGIRMSHTNLARWLFTLRSVHLPGPLECAALNIRQAGLWSIQLIASAAVR